jgi:hypothetical protein
MPDEETEPMPLGDRRHHRKLWRFDPTVSSGSLLQIATLLIGLGGAYATYQSDRATQKLEMVQVKETQKADRESTEKIATADRTSTKESIQEIKTDLRDLKAAVVEVNLTLARMTGSNGKGAKP